MTESSPHQDDLAVARVEAIIQYDFAHRPLLRCALTFPSWMNENRASSVKGTYVDNRVLEWLGDAVLHHAVTERMVRKRDVPLSKRTPARADLVSNQRLASVGETLGIWDALFLGRGDRSNNGNGRQTYLSNAVEAILGAVYMDASACEAVDAWSVTNAMVHRWLPEE